MRTRTDRNLVSTKTGEAQSDQIPRSGSEMAEPEWAFEGLFDDRAARHGGQLRQSGQPLGAASQPVASQHPVDPRC